MIIVSARLSKALVFLFRCLLVYFLLLLLLKLSYKEESEDGTDSDEIIEQDQDANEEYVEDDRECIERVLYSRIGRPGETGAITTVYAPDYEELRNRPDPLPGEPQEVQYLIKWKGWSHLHNTWETEKSLIEQNVKGIKKLSNLMKREQDIANW